MHILNEENEPRMKPELHLGASFSVFKEKLKEKVCHCAYFLIFLFLNISIIIILEFSKPFKR